MMAPHYYHAIFRGLLAGLIPCWRNSTGNCGLWLFRSVHPAAFQEKMAESLVGTWILQPQFDQIAQPLLLHGISKPTRKEIKGRVWIQVWPTTKKSDFIWIYYGCSLHIHKYQWYLMMMMMMIETGLRGGIMQKRDCLYCICCLPFLLVYTFEIFIIRV